jgi:prevent-host-death family protein
MIKKTYGAEEARTLLPELLERAHHGKATVITKRGKPYAAIVPVDHSVSSKSRVSILALEGSGRGLWGRDAAATVAKLRDEWA